MSKFNLVHDGIFQTIQGEGDLVGIPMVFVRLAGCSVGCDNCDTNYNHNQTVDSNEILRVWMCATNAKSTVNWYDAFAVGQKMVGMDIKN